MSATVFEIPTIAGPQTKEVILAGITYQLTLIYRDVPDFGGWFMDLADASGNSLLAGVPLVPCCDLLAQYQYLAIGGKLVVQSDQDPDAAPTFQNLGTGSHLYWIPDT